MEKEPIALSEDGRIVRIDNVYWSYYVNLDLAHGLEEHKCGKWMHFFRKE